MSPFSLLQLSQIKCYPKSSSVFYSIDDICRVCEIAQSDLIKQITLNDDPGLVLKRMNKQEDIYAEGSHLVFALESMPKTIPKKDFISAIISMINRDKQLIGLSVENIAGEIKKTQDEVMSMLTKTNIALLFERQNLDLYLQKK